MKLNVEGFLMSLDPLEVESIPEDADDEEDEEEVWPPSSFWDFAEAAVPW